MNAHPVDAAWLNAVQSRAISLVDAGHERAEAERSDRGIQGVGLAVVTKAVCEGLDWRRAAVGVSVVVCFLGGSLDDVAAISKKSSRSLMME